MARKPGDKLPMFASELDGVTKAAIILLSVGPERAGKILKEMPAELIEEVTREFAGIGTVTESLRNEVVEDFYGVTLASAFQSEGGLDYAKEILKNSLDSKSADRVLSQIQTQVQRTPFSFLQKAESESLLTFIQEEHPQTIALITCHLPHHKAAEILVGLPMQNRSR